MSKRSAPVATLSLIAICLVAAFFTLANPDTLLRWGYIPEPLGTPTAIQRVISALTSLFVHLDPMHLLANMLVLAAVGPAVERAAGAWRLLLVFIVSGLVGVGAHHAAAILVLKGMAGDALAGSSAAIAGLIGYAWLRFHRSKVPLLPNRWVPVWVVILVWVALQAAGAWFSAQQLNAPVAYFAHLFGFVTGFLLAFPLGAVAGAADEAWQEHLREAGRRGGAAKAAVLTGRQDAASLAELGAALESTGDADAAASAYAKQLVADPNATTAVEKLAAFGKLDLVSRADRMKAARSQAGANPDSAALLLDSVVQEPADAFTPSALESLVELQHDFDPVSAHATSRRLFAEYSLSPEAERVRAKYPTL